MTPKGKSAGRVGKELRRIAENIAQIHNNFDLPVVVYTKLRRAHNDLLRLAPAGTRRGR